MHFGKKCLYIVKSINIVLTYAKLLMIHVILGFQLYNILRLSAKLQWSCNLKPYFFGILSSIPLLMYDQFSKFSISQYNDPSYIYQFT